MFMCVYVCYSGSRFLLDVPAVEDLMIQGTAQQQLLYECRIINV